MSRRFGRKNMNSEKGARARALGFSTQPAVLFAYELALSFSFSLSPPDGSPTAFKGRLCLRFWAMGVRSYKDEGELAPPLVFLLFVTITLYITWDTVVVAHLLKISHVVFIFALWDYFVCHSYCFSVFIILIYPLEFLFSSYPYQLLEPSDPLYTHSLQLI